MGWIESGLMEPHTFWDAGPVAGDSVSFVEVSARIPDPPPAAALPGAGPFVFLDISATRYAITTSPASIGIVRGDYGYFIERPVGGGPPNIDIGALYSPDDGDGLEYPLVDGWGSMVRQFELQGFRPVGATEWDSSQGWVWLPDPAMERYVVYHHFTAPSLVGTGWKVTSISVLAPPPLTGRYWSFGPPPPDVPCRRLFPPWPYVDKRPRVDTGPAGTRRYRKPIV